MTVEELQTELDQRDKGVLRVGNHPEGDTFCALEFESQVRGREWSDKPITLPDLRPLNDAPWPSDEARTRALLPVMVAYWDWATWTPARRQATVERIMIAMVQQLIAELLELPEKVRVQCRAVLTLQEAVWAANAAAKTTVIAAEVAAGVVEKVIIAEAATWVAETVAKAAQAATNTAMAVAANAAIAAQAVTRAAEAARIATTGTTERVLRQVCQIWIHATLHQNGDSI